MHHDELVDYLANLLRENMRLRAEHERAINAQLEMIRAVARDAGG